MTFGTCLARHPTTRSETVRVKVQACGICHSDTLTKEGTYPRIQYPRVPGHEVVGVIDAVGPEVASWTVGQRVGVGCHGRYCGRCAFCRRVTALALVPDDLSPVEAAPLMCAGITTFNALRNSGAKPGDVVAVLGIGGLGHLGVQYAAKLGFRTVAIARGKDKEALAKQLGAQIYIDTEVQDPAAELLKLGGAKAILATVTSSDV